MSIVVCKLPDAGLGNQLFPLLHAYLFARLNNLPVIVVGYHRLKIGPYLRGEKNKRTYNGFFCFQKNAIGEYSDRVRIRNWEKKARVVTEPEVREMDAGELKNKVFVFEQVADYDDYFGRLKEHRQQVKDILDSLVHPAIKKKLNHLETPVIGIHVRMGDFRKLTTGEEYKSGHVRTPQAYFVKCIRKIREMNGNYLPVTIFTDGYKAECRNA